MEKLLSKYFWVFNLFTLALVAYLTASGTGELVASKVDAMLPSPAPSSSPRAMRPTRMPQTSARPDGTDILMRNIFDSEVGPIDPNAVNLENIEDAPVAPGDLPIVPCSGGRVKVLATVADKTIQDWSFAAISEDGNNKLCRVGDSVTGRTVTGITWRYVFLRGSNDECYIDMYDDGTGTGPVIARPSRLPEEEGGAAPDASVADGIQVVSETERIIDRSLVEKMLADPTQFIRSVRVRPQRENGKVVGFRLRRFQQDSPIALLGAQRGDVIQAVNGNQLTSVEQALSVYQNLRSSSDLNFTVLRNGQPVELTVRIR
jgi:type II secretion system protein C